MLRNHSIRGCNAVFGNVAGVAPDKVTVELLKVKCLPVLLYGLEACPISNKQFKPLDCTERLLRKDISYKIC